MSNSYKQLVVGTTLIAIINAIFDNRILRESSEAKLSTYSRAIRIRDIRTQIISFIKRNPNSVFELIVPEYLSDTKIHIIFVNFNSNEIDDEDSSISKYIIEVDESYTEAKITNKVRVGKNIVWTLKAKTS